MEIRKKAIQSHLLPLHLPKSLLEESTYIGLECYKLCTKLSKICAGIGLVLASSNRGFNYPIKKVCSLLDVKYKHLTKHLHTMRSSPPSESLKKIPKLEDLLDSCQAEPEIRQKAYCLIETKQCSTALQAISTAYSGDQAILLAQQQSLLTAKHNKIDSLEISTHLRLERLIKGQPLLWDSIPCISLLDSEKDFMAKALNISYYQYKL